MPGERSLSISHFTEHVFQGMELIMEIGQGSVFPRLLFGFRQTVFHHLGESEPVSTPVLPWACSKNSLALG